MGEFVAGSTNLLIDVGSTIIKFARINESGEIVERGFIPRNYDVIAGHQTESLVNNTLNWNSKNGAARICSSANGGLCVGVLGYTERYSGEWAAKAVLNSGANVNWLCTLENWGDAPRSAVDILVIAGGADEAPELRQIKWLDELRGLPIKTDAVVFAGNSSLRSYVQLVWPGAIIADNVLGLDFAWRGDALSKILREAYLNDLVSRKGIGGLQALSEVPIMPTPAVVQLAYRALLNHESTFHFPTPMVIIDVGGATTDIFYGGELLDDSHSGQPRPAVNRHVFTNLGVFASRESLISAIVQHDRLGDFLRATGSSISEQRYLALREGETSWLTPETLAEACCFLALIGSANGAISGHRIKLGRAASVVVTGGASQICNVDRLEAVIHAAGATHAKCFLDVDYRLWVEGLLRLTPVKGG